MEVAATWSFERTVTGDSYENYPQALKDKDLQRELDSIHRTPEGAHDRINHVMQAAAEVKDLRAYCDRLQRQIEDAHERVNAMAEALQQARADAQLARVTVTNQEQRLNRLIEQLRQDGVGLGYEALKIIGQMLPSRKLLVTSPPKSPATNIDAQQ